MFPCQSYFPWKCILYINLKYQQVIYFEIFSCFLEKGDNPLEYSSGLSPFSKKQENIWKQIQSSRSLSFFKHSYTKGGTPVSRSCFP